MTRNDMKAHLAFMSKKKETSKYDEKVSKEVIMDEIGLWMKLFGIGGEVLMRLGVTGELAWRSSGY